MSGLGEVSAVSRDTLWIHLVQPAYRLRRFARPSQRKAVVCFRQGLRLRRVARDWPLTKKREWVLHRLRHSVRRAHRDTPYYRDLFQRVGFNPAEDFGFEDFAQLPELTSY
jgi:hypothetical protein